MSVHLGFDLQTTHLLAAIVRGDHPFLHDWGDLGAGIRLPCVMSEVNGHTVVGQPALQSWIAGSSDSIDLWTSSNETTFGHILMTLFAAAAQDLGDPVATLAIAVPAGWGEPRLEAVRRAAIGAGLPAPQIISALQAILTYAVLNGTLSGAQRALGCRFDADAATIATLELRCSGAAYVVHSRSDPCLSLASLDGAIAAHSAALAGVPAFVEAPGAALLSVEQRPLSAAVAQARTRLCAAYARQATGSPHAHEPLPEPVSFVASGTTQSCLLSPTEFDQILAPFFDRLGQLLPQDRADVAVVLEGDLCATLALRNSFADPGGAMAQIYLLPGQGSAAYGAALIAAGRVSYDTRLPVTITLIARSYMGDGVERLVLLPAGAELPKKQCSVNAILELEGENTQTLELELELEPGDGQAQAATRIIRRCFDFGRPYPPGVECVLDLAIDESYSLSLTMTVEKTSYPITIDLTSELDQLRPGEPRAHGSNLHVTG